MKEIVSIWIAVAVIVMTYLLLPEWALVSAAIPVFVLLWRHIRHELPLSQMLAIVCCLVFSSQILITIDNVGSRHFSDFDWPGKVAAVSAFAYLWLVPRYYLPRLPNGTLSGLMFVLRTLFWMALPLIYLRSAFRHFPEFSPLILWISVGISFAVYQRFEKAIYGKELLLLTVTTCLVALGGGALEMSDGKSNTGDLAIIVGLFFFAAVTRYNQSYLLLRERPITRLPVIQNLVSFGYYFAPFALAALAIGISNEFAAAMAVLVFYWMALMLLWPRMGALRHRSMKHLGHHFRLFWFTTLMLPIAVLLERELQIGLMFVSLTATVGLGYVLHGPLPYRRLFYGKESNRSLNFCLYQATVLLTYWVLITAMTKEPFGPVISGAFILHAVALFFVGRKTSVRTFDRMGFALFIMSLAKIFLYDMRDFSMVEKIVSFLIIGVFLLVAAFQYQRNKPTEIT